MEDFDSFDRDFNFIRKLFKIVFVITLVSIVLYYVAIVVIGVSLVNNPEEVGEFIGTVKKGFESVK